MTESLRDVCAEAYRKKRPMVVEFEGAHQFAELLESVVAMTVIIEDTVYEISRGYTPDGPCVKVEMLF